MTDIQHAGDTGPERRVRDDAGATDGQAHAHGTGDHDGHGGGDEHGGGHSHGGGDGHSHQVNPDAD